MADNTAITDEKLSKPWEFQKGNDPRRNLDGRPKGSYSLTTIIKRLLQEEQVTLQDGKKINAGEALTKKVLQDALKGDIQALKLIWNYVDGMPTTKNEHSGPNGGAIELKTVRDDFKSRIAGIIARSGTGSDNQ